MIYVYHHALISDIEDSKTFADSLSLVAFRDPRLLTRTYKSFSKRWRSSCKPENLEKLGKFELSGRRLHEKVVIVVFIFIFLIRNCTYNTHQLKYMCNSKYVRFTTI